MLISSNFGLPSTVVGVGGRNYSLSPHLRFRACPGYRSVGFQTKFPFTTTDVYKALLITNYNVPAAVLQQKLRIPNKRDEKLAGVLHETGSQNIILLCHGFRRSKEDIMLVNIATALANDGISAFRFDFSGNGESEGSSKLANFMTEVEDIRSVVEYFTGAKRKTIAALGHSKGGNVVLLYASKYHDIPAVVNVSSRYDLNRGLEEWLGKGFRERIKKDGYIEVVSQNVTYKITEETLKERLNVDMDEACSSISKNCKVLTVHGSADEVNPIEYAHGFSKIIPNHRLEIIQGADHWYSSHQDQLVSVVLCFIKELVQAGSNISI